MRHLIGTRIIVTCILKTTTQKLYIQSTGFFFQIKTCFVHSNVVNKYIGHRFIYLYVITFNNVIELYNLLDKSWKKRNLLIIFFLRKGIMFV